jgi:hypothetical protein
MRRASRPHPREGERKRGVCFKNGTSGGAAPNKKTFITRSGRIRTPFPPLFRFLSPVSFYPFFSVQLGLALIDISLATSRSRPLPGAFLFPFVFTDFCNGAIGGRLRLVQFFFVFSRVIFCGPENGDLRSH